MRRVSLRCLPHVIPRRYLHLLLAHRLHHHYPPPQALETQPENMYRGPPSLN
jgi:hypothetical protein